MIPSSPSCLPHTPPAPPSAIAQAVLAPFRHRDCPSPHAARTLTYSAAVSKRNPHLSATEFKTPSPDTTREKRIYLLGLDVTGISCRSPLSPDGAPFSVKKAHKRRDDERLKNEDHWLMVISSDREYTGDELDKVQRIRREMLDVNLEE